MYISQKLLTVAILGAGRTRTNPPKPENLSAPFKRQNRGEVAKQTLGVHGVTSPRYLHIPPSVRNILIIHYIAVVAAILSILFFLLFHCWFDVSSFPVKLVRILPRTIAIVRNSVNDNPFCFHTTFIWCSFFFYFTFPWFFVFLLSTILYTANHIQSFVYRFFQLFFALLIFFNRILLNFSIYRLLFFLLRLLGFLCLDS